MMPCLLLVGTTAHNMLITPKPRNAIDSELPEWHGGIAPYTWDPSGGGRHPFPKANYSPAVDGYFPCACRNGTVGTACESAQTCLWFSVGCTIGCKECDGGSQGGANPNAKDRCGGGMKATLNDPKYRTLNRDAPAGSDADWTKFNPWRAPGNAPVYDPCGMAGGAPHPTPGHGEFTDTVYAKFGDRGSKVLPKYPTGTMWEAGATVQTMQSIRANHGGGYQYRLCPADSELTEACFQQSPMPFADDSSLMLSNGTMVRVKSTFVSEGTLPVGSTWQMLPIPDTHTVPGGGKVEGWGFAPPCYEPRYPDEPLPFLSQARCSGQWITNITIYDQLRVPADLPPGEYVLGLRWDCETSAQVWSACADVTITAPKEATHA